jgi:hypothetical protein
VALEAVRTGSRDLLYYLASQALASVKLRQDDATGAAELYRAPTCSCCSCCCRWRRGSRGGAVNRRRLCIRRCNCSGRSRT